MEAQPEYATWDPHQLIDRITFLERQLKEQTTKSKATSVSPKPNQPPGKPKSARVNRQIDPRKYTTRFIALKFAYLGQRYNGLEYHTNNKTPLPTVEEELWKALNKGCLIFPTPNPLLKLGEPNWEGCEYSKCGRTDRGVSAFGQVIGIRVRSKRPVAHAQSSALGEGNLSSRGFLRDLHLINNDPATPSIDPVQSNGDYHPTQQPHLENSEVASLAIDIMKSNGDDEPFESIEPSLSSSDELSSIPPTHDELPYCQILNRLLPPDIRVLAWCPNPPPDFSARFSCRERQYKYFFTQPAFAPSTSSVQSQNERDFSNGSEREGWLNIEAMRKAARKFIGVHDFRHFCKVDPSKQIDNFQRRIFHADIEYLDPQHGPAGYVRKQALQPHENSFSFSRSCNDPAGSVPTMPTTYAFILHGSAFLWHQVRHMAAILFLIGQGLETPSLIDDLLDTNKTPCKPQYEMADDAPLVLWDCIFPATDDDVTSSQRIDALQWIYVGDKTGPEEGIEKGSGRKREGRNAKDQLIDDIWKVWRSKKMDEILAGSLLDVVAAQGDSGSSSNPRAGGNEEAPFLTDKGAAASTPSPQLERRSQKVFQGGDGPRLVGKYVPVMQRPRMESVEVQNRRYALRKGFEQREEVKERGFRRFEVEEGGGDG